MYRNQYEYDNAEPQGMGLREIVESHVAAMLDKRDPDTVEEMVSHAALWLTDEVNPLLEALVLIGDSKFHAISAAIRDIDPSIASGLLKLGIFTDKAREEFIIEKAEELLNEAAE